MDPGSASRNLTGDDDYSESDNCCDLILDENETQRLLLVNSFSRKSHKNEDINPPCDSTEVIGSKEQIDIEVEVESREEGEECLSKSNEECSSTFTLKTLEECSSGIFPTMFDETCSVMEIDTDLENEVERSSEKGLVRRRDVLSPEKNYFVKKSKLEMRDDDCDDEISVDENTEINNDAVKITDLEGTNLFHTFVEGTDSDIRENENGEIEIGKISSHIIQDSDSTSSIRGMNDTDISADTDTDIDTECKVEIIKQIVGFENHVTVVKNQNEDQTECKSSSITTTATAISFTSTNTQEQGHKVQVQSETVRVRNTESSSQNQTQSVSENTSRADVLERAEGEKRALARYAVRTEIAKWKYLWEIASYSAAMVAREKEKVKTKEI